jgi:hypothetical protein
MTGTDRKGQSEDFSPAFKSRSCRRRHQETSGVLRELSQPPPTNGTENVFAAAAIQIQTPLLPNSRCHPRLPPKSISRSRRPLPLTPKSFTKRYTIIRPARPRPSLITNHTRLLTQLPSPLYRRDQRYRTEDQARRLHHHRHRPVSLSSYRRLRYKPAVISPPLTQERRNHVQQTPRHRYWL